MDVQLAANILHLAKKLAPDRVPQPDPETTAAWARSLDKNYPPQLWEDAVHIWATNLVTDRMLTPKDMLQAATTAVTRWESDPIRAPQLRAHRQQLQDERDKQLKEGSFARLRGYQPRAIPATPGYQPNPEDIIRKLLQGKKPQ